MTLKIGQQLQQGRFIIKRQLGSGGMGTVYEAAARNLAGQPVAIKENDRTSKRAQVQFEREAILLARLNHPNLPRVTDYFIEPSGRQYLVMDYIDGMNLQQLLHQEKRFLPEADVLAWIEKVMDALEYMHSTMDGDSGQPTPITHRDIKPSNIIKRGPQDEIFLVDFGLAKQEAEAKTSTGARGITPGYSPLEQYSGGTDTRCDIYALGATLYTLLTRQRPPAAPDIAKGRPLLGPRRLNPAITRNTDRVILKAMHTQADERYQSIGELRAALRRKNALPVFAIPAKWLTLSPMQATRTALTRLRPQAQQPRSRASQSPASNPLLLTSVVLIVAAFIVALLMVNRESPLSSPAPTSTSNLVMETPSGQESPTAAAVVLTTNTTMVVTTTNTPALATPLVATRLPRGATPRGVLTTAAPLPTPTKKATPARTATPTKKPTQTATALNTPTPQSATAAPRPTNPPPTNTPNVNPAWAVTLITPTDGDTGSGRRTFSWHANFTLAENHAFELIFWKDGQDPLNNGLGFAGFGFDTNAAVECHLITACHEGTEYMWGVRLVQVTPYKPVRFLGGGHRFRFSSPANSESPSRSGLE